LLNDEIFLKIIFTRLRKKKKLREFGQLSKKKPSLSTILCTLVLNIFYISMWIDLNRKKKKK